MLGGLGEGSHIVEAVTELVDVVHGAHLCQVTIREAHALDLLFGEVAWAVGYLEPALGGAMDQVGGG